MNLIKPINLNNKIYKKIYNKVYRYFLSIDFKRQSLKFYYLHSLFFFPYISKTTKNCLITSYLIFFRNCKVIYFLMFLVTCRFIFSRGCTVIFCLLLACLYKGEKGCRNTLFRGLYAFRSGKICV